MSAPSTSPTRAGTGLDPDAVLRIAAFSAGDTGGNPAGVWIGPALPPDDAMQRLAYEVGFSETAFAAPLHPEEGADVNAWRVRYFSPAKEVPFCGHATIALGAALAQRCGDGVFALTLNHTAITVEGRRDPSGQTELVSAALQSPPSHSRPADALLAAEAMALFGFTAADLDPRIPPGLAYAGNNHLVLALASRASLAAMRYDQELGRDLMAAHGLATIVLVWGESDQLLHTRNPFAIGGVYEDPATGSGTAALAGYLRDLGWPHGGAIDVIQGEDMGMRSCLHADIPAEPATSIRVAGTARFMP